MKGDVKGWAAFLFVGCLAWGMSFMWIKIALLELGPFNLVTYRMAFGVATLWLLISMHKIKLDVTAREVGMMLVLGVTNTAIPVTLISWAEIHISSALAGILNGTMPLWTILLAHLFLHDERITPFKFGGLVVGFVGLILLVGKDLGAAGLTGPLMGKLAVILAAVLYAGSNVFIRKNLKGRQPLQTAGISLLGSLAFMLIVTPFMEPFPVLPRRPMTWLACAWMGVMGIAFAYQAYFYLINHWGATRTALVTYVFPVAAVALGVIFLSEPLTWRLAVGGLLIIGGIALVNLAPRRIATVQAEIPKP